MELLLLLSLATTTTSAWPKAVAVDNGNRVAADKSNNNVVAVGAKAVKPIIGFNGLDVVGVVVLGARAPRAKVSAAAATFTATDGRKGFEEEEVFGPFWGSFVARKRPQL